MHVSHASRYLLNIRVAHVSHASRYLLNIRVAHVSHASRYLLNIRVSHVSHASRYLLNIRVAHVSHASRYLLNIRVSQQLHPPVPPCGNPLVCIEDNILNNKLNVFSLKNKGIFVSHSEILSNIALCKCDQSNRKDAPRGNRTGSESAV